MRIAIAIWVWCCWSLAAVAFGQLPAEKAVQQIVPAEGLRVQLFAAEPQLFAPTAIDIDEQGRVWVAEGVNYRQASGPRIKEPPYFPTPLRKTGDRIVVLEDTDGDGRCDTSRVFYEGLDINSPQGFAVFGGKVWISQSPSIRTIDIKPDGTAGEMKTLVTGFGAIHGDHSVHSVYLGPDRKVYGCFGDDHTVLTLPDGKKIDNWSGVKGGVVFRMNLDATGFEVLGDNFRNGYECATDSFGTTFYSDNDDDEGNLYCRFLYVMQGGNFGHGPIPPRGLDWNLERAGVVPYLMRTGGGAPAGLCIYEGNLLPAKYRGMPMLAETGTGELLGFRMIHDGAGFRIGGGAVDPHSRQTIDTLRQTRKPDVLLRSDDRWFRPTDVAVAPDGSVFVSDFYNHVAGGRKLDGEVQGRIYRLIPADHDGSYKPRHIPLNGSDGALISALASPNLATRAAALLRIEKKHAGLLADAAAKSAGSRLRPRALFALALLGEEERKLVAEHLRDSEVNIRVAVMRALAVNGGLSVEFLKPLAKDWSPQVRREALLALRQAEASAAAQELIVDLALQYDGYDRWYLEAALLAMSGPNKDKVRQALLEKVRLPRDRAAANWLWALAPNDALKQFLQIAADASAPLADRAVAVEGLALFDKPEAGEALLKLVAPSSPPELVKPAIRGLATNIERHRKLLTGSPDLLAKLETWTSNAATRDDALRLAKALGTRALAQWRLSPAYPAPQAEGFDKVFPPEEAAAPERTGEWTPAKVGADGLVDLAAQRKPNTNAVGYAVTLIDAPQAVETRLLAGSDDGIKIWLNGKLIHSNNITRSAGPRADAVNVKFPPGLNRLLVKVNQGTGGWGLVVEVEDPFAALTEVTADEVAALADPKDRLDPSKLPADAELLAIQGDAARGRGVFLRATTACTKCHSIGGQGAKTTVLGPALDGIGKKMGRDALLESVLRPDAKVQPQWVAWTVVTTNGKTHTGLVAEEKPNSLTLIDAAGKRTTIAKSEIEEKKQSELSVMPQRLVGTLSARELSDLLQFLVEQ